MTPQTPLLAYHAARDRLAVLEAELARCEHEALRLKAQQA
jgi:hypothetical protein